MSDQDEYAANERATQDFDPEPPPGECGTCGTFIDRGKRHCEGCDWLQRFRARIESLTPGPWTRMGIRRRDEGVQYTFLTIDDNPMAVLHDPACPDAEDNAETLAQLRNVAPHLINVAEKAILVVRADADSTRAEPDADELRTACRDLLTVLRRTHDT